MVETLEEKMRKGFERAAKKGVKPDAEFSRLYDLVREKKKPAKVRKPEATSTVKKIITDHATTGHATRLGVGLLFAILAYRNAERIHVKIMLATNWFRRLGRVADIETEWVRYALYISSPATYLMDRYSGGSAGTAGSVSIAVLIAEYNRSYEKYLRDLEEYEKDRLALEKSIEAEIATIEADIEKFKQGAAIDRAILVKAIEDHEATLPDEFEMKQLEARWHKKKRRLQAALEAHDAKWEERFANIRRRIVATRAKMDDFGPAPKKPEKHPLLVPSTDEVLFYTAMAFMMGYYPEMIPQMIDSFGGVVRGIGEIIPL